jgi:hypothetical protein
VVWTRYWNGKDVWAARRKMCVETCSCKNIYILVYNSFCVNSENTSNFLASKFSSLYTLRPNPPKNLSIWYPAT